MHSTSIFTSSSSLSCSGYFSASQPFRFFPTQRIHSVDKSSTNTRFSLISWPIQPPPPRYIVRSTATQEVSESTSGALSFVETGYISRVHGLQGEVRVKPSTDFPEVRFLKPGLRWLKQRHLGMEALQEIELIEGRGAGQNWIVRFNNIDTMEQAQKLVGSTILVKDEDRPVLEEGEFYTNDLIGMGVLLKESGERVGTVVNVFETGANDLLHVQLNSKNTRNQIGKDNSGPLVWVPFVEAIIPNVDLEKREMLITPPKGLLELNIRADERSKKERRQLEWKERKRFQRRLIVAKKKLAEMEQKHVFDGFGCGEKDKANLLANEIVSVNSNLLQQALEKIETPSTRSRLIDVLSSVPDPHIINVSDTPSSSVGDEQSDSYCSLKRKGQLLNSIGKVAVCLVIEKTNDAEMGSSGDIINSKRNKNVCLSVKSILDDHSRFIQIKDRPSVPLILVSSADSIPILQEQFSNHDYFAFDPEKVWFIEEGKLPVVSSSVEGHGKHKILMKSPWEFLQKSIGSGGVITLFSSQDPLLEQLGEIGVEYIEICKASRNREHGHTLLGLVESCKANVGIHLFKDIELEQDFEVIFSMSFLRKLTKQMNKLPFCAVLGQNPHVVKVHKDWVDIVPSAPNSYEIRASIYSCLDATPINKVCVLSTNVE